jgi:hypothetical protein
MGFLNIWYILTREYYSAIKKKEIMLFAGKWVEVETIMLSKIRQTQKDKYVQSRSKKKIRHEHKREIIGGRRREPVGDKWGKERVRVENVTEVSCEHI